LDRNNTPPSSTSFVNMCLSDGLNPHAINGTSPSNAPLREQDFDSLLSNDG
tara:strand:+ start:223 stop:375 length:153 start_codon:yes stop_codon:yes gene_type:complete